VITKKTTNGPGNRRVRTGGCRSARTESDRGRVRADSGPKSMGRNPRRPLRGPATT
jgi:hypothetical protein